MRILVAPDKFKGSIDAAPAAQAIADALVGHEVRTSPIADGGEGTAALIGQAMGGRWIPATVTDPLGRPVEAGFWLVQSEEGAGLAIMEMSSASGFALVADRERDPWRASTFGTGELLLAARGAGVDEVWIGIGGSATNDGGAGMAGALGYRYIDAEGGEIHEATEIPERLMDADSMFPDLAVDWPEITVACDVTNPLLGPTGATRVYGPQKGVAADELERFEYRMAHFADLVEGELGCDFRETPGAGAAGGLGFGLLSFCEATLRPGFEMVAEATGLEQAIAAVDVVITGEGRLDEGSVMGKAPVSLARMAKAAGKPVVAVCGSVDEQSAAAAEFDAVWPLVAKGEDSGEAMKNPVAALKNRVAQGLPMLEGWAP